MSRNSHGNEKRNLGTVSSVMSWEAEFDYTCNDRLETFCPVSTWEMWDVVRELRGGACTQAEAELQLALQFQKSKPGHPPGWETKDTVNPKWSYPPSRTFWWASMGEDRLPILPELNSDFNMENITNVAIYKKALYCFPTLIYEENVFLYHHFLK